MSSLLDAIGTAGTALDRFTGGRAVRGLLAGRPRELMSVIPFSETMGLTAPDEVTSGRDLLDQYGLTDPQSKGWGPMLGGMAVEMATSPLSYLGGFGAAKAAPEAASLAQRATPAVGKFLAEESGSLSPAIVAQRAAELAGKLGLEPTKLAKPLRTALESEAARALEREAVGGAAAVVPDPANLMRLVSRPATWMESRKPKQVLTEMADEMAHKLVGNIAGREGVAAPPESVGMARSFFDLPKLPRGQDRANALLDSLAARWENSLHALGRYTGPNFRDINAALRNAVDMGVDVADLGPAQARLADELGAMRAAARANVSWGPGQLEDWALLENFQPGIRTLGGRILDLMDQMKTPQPLQLHRGVSWLGAQKLARQLGVPLGSPEAVGRTLFEPAFMSTSLDPAVIKDFTRTGPALNLVLDQAAGRPATFLNALEKEVLLPPGQRMQIQEILDPGTKYTPSTIRAKLLQALLAAMGAGGAGYAALQDQSAPTLPVSPAA